MNSAAAGGAGEDALDLEPAQSYWLLTSFCAIHQKAIDPDALARECVQSMPVEQLARVADGLGMHAEALAVEASTLPTFSRPMH